MNQGWAERFTSVGGFGMMQFMSEQAQAGWYPDDQGIERYWDGTAWTPQVRGPLARPVPSVAAPVEKKDGAFSKFGSAIKQAASDRQAAKEEVSRKQEEDAQAAGVLVTSGVFGVSTIEIYAGGYVRVAGGQSEATQPARMTNKTPYEKLRSIKFTAAGTEQQPSTLESTALLKGASSLMKGGSGLLRASAPGLAVAGLSQVAKSKLGKTFLTIATDKAIHTLTNETHNGWMKVSNKGHNDVGLALEEAGYSVLGLAGRGAHDSSSVQHAVADVERTDEPQAAITPRSAEPSVGERLRELADLHRDGILSDEEFASAKAKQLGL